MSTEDYFSKKDLSPENLIGAVTNIQDCANNNEKPYTNFNVLLKDFPLKYKLEGLIKKSTQSGYGDIIKGSTEFDREVRNAYEYKPPNATSFQNWIAKVCHMDHLGLSSEKYNYFRYTNASGLYGFYDRELDKIKEKIKSRKIKYMNMTDFNNLVQLNSGKKLVDEVVRDLYGKIEQYRYEKCKSEGDYQIKMSSCGDSEKECNFYISPEESQSSHIINFLKTNNIDIVANKINIYTKGGHFDTHVDTPKTGNIASLVVDISNFFENNNYSGGDLVIDDETIDLKNNNCVCFYSDMPHKVTKVTEGTRVTMTFYVMIKNSYSMNLLQSPSQDHKPLVGFVSKYDYSATELKSVFLKGADKELVDFYQSQGKKIIIEPVVIKSLTQFGIGDSYYDYYPIFTKYIRDNNKYPTISDIRKIKSDAGFWENANNKTLVYRCPKYSAAINNTDTSILDKFKFQFPIICPNRKYKLLEKTDQKLQYFTRGNYCAESWEERLYFSALIVVYQS